MIYTDFLKLELLSDSTASMESVVWQNADFSSHNLDFSRKRRISHSFYWLTLNLLSVLWMSTFISPSTLLSNMLVGRLYDFLVSGAVFGVFTLFMASCVFHIYSLINALDFPFPCISFGTEKTFLPPQRDTALFGPNIFSPTSNNNSFSRGHCSAVGSWLELNASTSFMENNDLNRSNVSWFSTTKSSSPSQNLNGSTSTTNYFSNYSPTSLDSSFSTPQTRPHMASSPLFTVPTVVDSVSPLDNSWSSAICRPLWPTVSPASFQYQLSPSSTTSEAVVHSFSGERTLSSGRLDKLGQSLSDQLIAERNAFEYWKNNCVSTSELDRWTINLRRWIHGTIVRRVVEEINLVNKKLLEASEDAAIIGSTTLNTLEQLAKGRYQHISSLHTLIRFLNCTKEQGYLVFRLRELARGSCLEEFRWDGGSRSVTSPWKEHLPTDTMILLHLFSVYMDCRLPPHPKCLSGRPFGQLHVIRNPDKPDLKAKYTAQLYLSKIQPPAVKLVIDESIYTFPENSKNFFHALLMFFHFYLKLDGTIRYISLGSSGLNIAWVFKDH